MSAGDVTFTSIGMLCSFLIAVWFAGRFLNSTGISSIPAEICVGLLYGPYGLDLIPHFSHSHSLMLLGFLGVSLVIFESGMHLNVNKVMNWDIGGHAFLVAVFGTLLPVGLAIACFSLFGFEPYPHGLAAGFSLAPTSVGISLALLSQARQLNSRGGQVIMSAAFLDDVFSVICLVVMTNLASGNFDYLHHTIFPFVQAAVFVVCGLFFSTHFFPAFASYVLNPQGLMKKALGLDAAIKLRDEAHLSLMFGIFLVFSWIGDVIGSSLLGAFVAGIMFSNIPRSHLLWRRQLNFIQHWLLRIFFSATVAFSIQVTKLLTWPAFWKGAVMGLVPCIGSKLLCGVLTGEIRWIVGVAMVARGEFAYLVAEQANHLDLLTDNEFAIIMWALLWATLLAPVMFGYALDRYTMKEINQGKFKRALEIGGSQFSGQSTFIIRLIGMHRFGMVRELCNSLYILGFDVLESVTESDGHFGTGTFVVCPRDAVAIEQKLHIRHNNFSTSEFTEDELKRYKACTDLDENKLHEISTCLKETMVDDDVQVLFEPTDANKEKTILEVECFGENSRSVMQEITHYLMVNCHLNILKAVVDERGLEVDFCVFYCSRAAPPSTIPYSHGNSGTLSRANSEPSILASSGEIGITPVTATHSQSTTNLHETQSPTALSQISEEEMDGIREYIRQVYVSKGLRGGEALVRMVHSSELIYSFNSKTLKAKKSRKRSSYGNLSKVDGQSEAGHGSHVININFDQNESVFSRESDSMAMSDRAGGTLTGEDLSSIV